ncbi:sensor histidine kinase [Halobellus sp. EA9]|uniref:sensor histidine kinase n=1 Tax=Halobellus sp. EA9 TaxID=3421647 RepID=UPI003EC0B3E8
MARVYLAGSHAIIEPNSEVLLVNIVGKCWKNVRTDEATIEIVDEVTITGDRSRLQHVFENLFRNALEHGGPAVTVRVGQIDDSGFYVEDTGPGISKEPVRRYLMPDTLRQAAGRGLG